MKKRFFLGFDDFFGSENKRKKKFPFLIDMTVTMWHNIARPIVSITELTLGSALNSLIRFEISHPYSKETQQRKDEFPFAVDMHATWETWKKLIKSMNGMNILPKLTKNQLSTGDAKV